MRRGAATVAAVDSPVLVAALVAIALYALFVAGLALAGRGPEARALARLVPDCLVLARGLLGDREVPAPLQARAGRRWSPTWPRRSTSCRTSCR